MKTKKLIKNANLKTIPKTKRITQETENLIIKNYTDGMCIKDICNTLGIYRKPVEKLLISRNLITLDKCKYY